MPGIEDYLPNTDPTKPAAKAAPTAPAKGGIEAHLPKDPVLNDTGIQMSKATNVDISSYLPYLKNGVNSDFDIDRKRAENQRWYEQVAKGAGNAVINTATGLAEGIGYLGSLATEWGDDRDYSNALTKTMQSWKNMLGEVYRQDPSSTFDMTDSAWWVENIQGLAESAGAFALEGAALGSMFGGLARKAAGMLGKEAVVARQGVNAAAHLASAATLAYTEGAMSGYRTYDAAFQYQRDKLLRDGIDPKEADTQARHIAANAAATTVKLNTIVNTALGLTALAPMFKSDEDLVEAYMRKKGAGALAEGETMDQLKERLKKASFDDPALKKMLMHREGITSLASEAIQEGIEEVNTQYAEQEGKRVGEGKSHRNLFDQLTALGTYFDDVTNSEGALNFVLGAAGGVAQTVLLDHIPTRKVLKYDENNQPILKDGSGAKPKYETEIVTAKTANEQGIKRHFENMRDAVLEDITHYQQLEKNLAVAIASKNEPAIKDARAALFQISALNAITLGQTESWQQQYKNVAGLDNTKDLGEAMQPQIDELRKQSAAEQDPEVKKQLDQEVIKLMQQQQQLTGTTEAMQKGYASDMKDNSYKAKSEQAVADLEHLQKMHSDIQRKHFDQFNPASAELADHIFWRKSDLYLRKRNLAEYKAHLDAQEFDLDDSLIHSDDFYELSSRAANQHKALTLAHQRLETDLEKIKAAATKGDTKALLAYVQKYRAAGKDMSDLPGVVKELYARLQHYSNKYNEKIGEVSNQLADSTGYNKWLEKNPGGSIQDFVNKVNANTAFVTEKANYEEANTAYQVAQDGYNEMMSNKSQRAFMKAVANDRAETVKAINERNRKANVALMLAQQERAAEASANRDNIAREMKQIDKELDVLQSRYTALETQQEYFENKNAELEYKGFFSNILTITRNLRELGRIRSEMKRIEAEHNTLKERHDDMRVRYNIADNDVQEAKADPVPPSAPAEEPQAPPAPPVEPTPEPAKEPQPEEPAATEEGHDDANFAQPGQHEYNLSELGLSEDEVTDINDLPDVVKLSLDNALKEMGPTFSYDVIKKALEPFVNSGTINQATANELQVVAKNVHNMVHVAQQSSEGPLEPVEPTPTADTVVIPKVDEPDSFPTSSNLAVISPEMLNELIHEEDREKAIDAIKGNSSALEYKEFPLEDGTIIIQNVTDENGNPVLDKNADTRLMKPNGVPLGSKVKVSVDSEWKGNVLTDEDIDPTTYKPKKGSREAFGNKKETADSFADYVDENGKIIMTAKEGEKYPAYANMPIKIVTESGVTTYLPRVAWIEQSNGAGNYRNVQDVYRSGDDWVVDNVAKQVRDALALRKIIAERYNANKDTHAIDTVIDERSAGKLMYSGKVNLKTGEFIYKMQSAAKQLPSKTLVFGVIGNNGEVRISDGQTFPLPAARLSVRQQQYRGAPGTPVVMIPMANGTFQPAPLETRRFADRKADINTMLRAIEIYLQHNTEDEKTDDKHQAHLDHITKHTGFDITTEEGLRGFINQYYTHSASFDDGVLSANAAVAEGQAKIQKFLFAIPNRRPQDAKTNIKVGTSYSNQAPVYARLVNGKLDTTFADAFVAGVSNRFKNVALSSKLFKGVNSADVITEVRINEDGSVYSKKYENYNEYLKSFTRTAVYGGHTADDGTHIYSANSQVRISPEPIWNGQIANAKDTASSLVEELPKATSPEGTEAKTDIPLFDDDMMDPEFPTNFNLAPSSSIQSMQISPKGTPLSFETLDVLRSITPSIDRNDMTPEDVLKRLQSLGITHIAEGYNPFVRCS